VGSGPAFRRYAVRLAVLVTAVALVGCGGGEPTPPPLAERFVASSDAPGSTIDPEETRQTAEDLEGFVATFRDFMVAADSEEMTAVFEEAGFRQAGTEVRFFGDTHSPEAPHVFSSFFEVGSEDDAETALDWLATDSLQPCPDSCAVEISEFEVDAIPDARGVHRLATAAAIEAAGTPEQIPRDDYWIGFTVGSSVYTMELGGPPGSVTEQEALDIASAYHDRLEGE
jgi:hypothetical protein